MATARFLAQGSWMVVEIFLFWARLGTIGHDWARLGTIGHDWARLGTIGHDWARLGTIGGENDKAWFINCG
jgi:hypothetical protein